ncbi:MAG: glycoside hydrolase family 3 N-terminal domain-containing protein, partial [Pseudomonadota bacterium]
VLNDLPMAMTAHIRFQAVDEHAATLSSKMIALIRQNIGFEGLVMTDDISMKALQGSFPDIAKGALAAGCDVVLLCNAALSDRSAVADAAGELDPKGQARAEAALSRRLHPSALDIAAAEAELSALMGGQVYG